MKSDRVPLCDATHWSSASALQTRFDAWNDIARDGDTACTERVWGGGGERQWWTGG